MKLGMNVLELAPWSTLRLHKPCMQREPFWLMPTPGDWNVRVYSTEDTPIGPAPADSGGYYSMVASEGTLPTGEYVLTYDTTPDTDDDNVRIVGTAFTHVIRLGEHVSATFQHNIAESVILNILPGKLVTLVEIRSTLPPEDVLNTFAKKFHVVRWMDWCGVFSGATAPTPENAETGHQSRGDGAELFPNEPDSPRWRSDTGVPPRWIIESANEAGVDSWVNVPILYSDHEHKQLAGLYADTHHGHVYVALANEVWNDGFPQAALALRAAKTELPHPDAYVGRALIVLRRLAKIKTVWDAAFRDAGRDGECTAVFEWQAGNSWAVDFNEWDNGAPVCAEAQALLTYVGHAAIAPYFYGGGSDSSSPIVSSVPAAIERVVAWKALCDKLGVKLHLYE